MKKILCLLSALIVAIVASAQSQAIKFRHIDLYDGLSHNNVQSFYHDEHGFIWIGTMSGLNRYNGYMLKVFSCDNKDSVGLKYNEITDIYPDNDGNLWLFKYDQLNAIFNPSTESFSNDHPIFHNEVHFDAQFTTSMVVDNNKNLWISNSLDGIYKYNSKTNTLQHFIENRNEDNPISSNYVSAIAFDSEGYLWTCTTRGVLEKIDTTTMSVIQRTNISSGKTSDQVLYYKYKLFIDSDNDIWVHCKDLEDGAFCYSPITNSIKHFNDDINNPYHISNNKVSSISQDEQGKIWIGIINGGIAIYNKDESSIHQLKNEYNDEFSLTHNSINSIYCDRIGRMWIGTHKGGVNFYHANLFRFGLVRTKITNTNSVLSNEITCFAQDSKGFLWIGTNGKGISRFDYNKKQYLNFLNNPNDPNSISNNTIVCMDADNKGRLWIGAYCGGLIMYDGYKFTTFSHDMSNPQTLSNNNVKHVLAASTGKIWIATLGGGLDCLDPATRIFTHYKANDINSVNSNFVTSLSEDKFRNIWIGTNDGLDYLDYNTGRFYHFTHEANNKNSLISNDILFVKPDSRGLVWIGTHEGVDCFDPQSRVFRHFSIAKGMPSKSIVSCEENKSGHMWFSTLNGICNMYINNYQDINHFDYKIFNYNITDGLQGKDFNEQSSIKLENGFLFFGGNFGINMFDPNKLEETKIETNLVLTGLTVLNKLVAVGKSIDKEKPILSRIITETKKITLSHKQNVFGIQFASLNNLYPDRTLYKYKLEGFDKDWVTIASSGRMAVYTNLNPGKYTFRVIATDNSNEWCNQEATLEITIKPPFYASPLALFILCLLIVAACVWLLHRIKNNELNRYKQQQQRVENLRQHEVDEMKIKFLTNISHEFRTPLTLILTPIDKLLKQDISDDFRTYLEMIRRNGKRLYNLVNQLLDFQKMEKHNVKLNTSYGNIVSFVKATAESFTDLSESKNINYKFQSQNAIVNMYFDHDKLEKILFNLLSNAFRYTPDGGTISMEITTYNKETHNNSKFIGSDYVEIKVSDTGVGIAPDAKARIFERFFQSNNNNNNNNQGTGIGLAIAQEFVKVHGGTISVDSEIGKGSTFAVCLPITTDNQTTMPTPSQNSTEITEWESKPAGLYDNDDNQGLNNNQPKILVVEDNEDLRYYLRNNLLDEFVVSEARNGKEALEKMLVSVPDIVVSDILLLEMSGIELCATIKNNEDWSHIPIILLTASASEYQAKKGIGPGADDFVTKPFDYAILLMKIKKLLEIRGSMQQMFQQKLEISPSEITITSMDEKFMQKAIKVTEEKMSNPDYSVARLSSDLGVSRGHLYNKILALTGRTPIEFIRIMRLKRAAQLLGKSQLSVSEIAYQVGFNDPRYFARYFKDEYNMTPSEYAKKNA